MPNSTAPQNTSRSSKSSWSWGKWIAIIFTLIFFALVMREVLYPFAGKKYIEFTHGSHSHYAPKNRNKNVPISKFPTQRPGPDKHITPDGKVVPNDK